MSVRHEADRDVGGAGQADHPAVGIVERLEGDHLVAGADQGEQGGGERSVAPVVISASASGSIRSP